MKYPSTRPVIINRLIVDFVQVKTRSTYIIVPEVQAKWAILSALGLVDLDLPLQSSGQSCCLLSLPLFCLCIPPRLSLLPGLARYSSGTWTGTDCKTLGCEPSLEDAAHHIKCARLDHAAPDGLTPPNSNVDNALESKREPVGGVLVE